MKPLRNGDLTDAAELIDSAQACAKHLAECCAVKDRRIRELEDLIVGWWDEGNEEIVFAFKSAVERIKEQRRNA